MAPVEGARLTVINPAPTAPYTGMLPGFVAGHYERDELEIDLVRLVRHAGARLILGVATQLDPIAKKVRVHGRPDINYDIASIDIGITSDMPKLRGVSDFGVPAKPRGPFAKRWETFSASYTGQPITVLGGGVAGVELALATHHRLRRSSPQVTLIEASTVLSGVAPRTRTALLNELNSKNVKIVEGDPPIEVTGEWVALKSGTRVASEFTVGAAGAVPFAWLQDTGLQLTEGYITVDETLRCVGEPSIYAVGDCAHLSHAPRPKAGVFAVRAAKTLTHNIRADLVGSSRKPFRPQRNYLKLISLGHKAAVADRGALSTHGGWAWGWKDRIDRRFMEKLNTLPEMAPEAQPKYRTKSDTPDLKPLCGACGAKVGSDVLERVLREIEAVDRSDVETTPGDDAAVLTAVTRKQVITTDHLRAFWSDPYFMSRIAALHALGDVFAMGAEPQAVLAQITLPSMEERLQESWLTEIMSAVGAVCRETGASLAGGHTSMGAELQIGFTVTGLLEQQPLSLSGAKPGDRLVLTRPIGSGTILAGEMEGKAHGPDVTACLATMSENSADTAKTLTSFASALTDVTGFGLAGHAARMAKASDAGIVLDVGAVPFYQGAVELAHKGVRSTIFSANRAIIDGNMPDTPEAALLCDPQTCGGFLASVPEASLAELKDQIPNLAIVGEVVPFEGQVIRIR